MRQDLPPIALSVRQPSAWAIIHGGKDIENRSLGSVRAGRMDCRTICIHAAIGLKEAEYNWSVYKFQPNGVMIPRPDALPRRAIIGTVDVVDIVDHSDSPWFGGPMGLVLQNPTPIDPIPCTGELGYFEWHPDGDVAEPLPWMRKWGRNGQDLQTQDLFDDLPTAFKTAPPRPYK
ncbi:MAG: hypothetical protein ACFB11_07650 [Paracoccaceae bacterium]